MSNIINPYRFGAAAPPGFTNTYSAALDGTGDYVSTMFDPNGSIGDGDYTYAWWFKLDTVAPSFQTIMYMGNSAASWDYNHCGIVSNKIKVTNRVGGYDTVAFTDPTVLSIDTWYHAAMVRQKSPWSWIMTFYLNATVATSPSGTWTSDYNGADFSTSSALLIGEWWSGGYSTDGKIDEVAIWNVALDSANIKAIYNSGDPTDLTTDSGDYDQSSDLIMYLRMGDDNSGSGTDVTDASGNSNDGTLENGAAFEADAP